MEYAVIDDEKAISSQVVVNIRLPCLLCRNYCFQQKPTSYSDTSKNGKMVNIKSVKVAVHS